MSTGRDYESLPVYEETHEERHDEEMDEEQLISSPISAADDDEDDEAIPTNKQSATSAPTTTMDKPSTSEQTAEGLSTTPATVTSSSSSSSLLRPPRMNDGVFSNLSAKPDSTKPSTNANDDTLPPYAAVANDTVPPYPVIVTIDDMSGATVGGASVTTSGDRLLMDGLPVGSPMGFFGAMMVAFLFQIVGFIVAFVVSTTYAGRLGARAGLGLVLISFGLNLRGHSFQYSYNENTGYYEETPVSPDENAVNIWLCYVLMVVGWFLTIQSTGDYIRAHRTERMLRTASNTTTREGIPGTATTIAQIDV
jgi:hypothetical protein